MSHSEWGSSIVAVEKKDGSVRICRNYKNTLNPVLKPVAPPPINVEDILANLCGGVAFSKLDLAHAYNQMEVEEDSKQFLTLSTHKGLFQQNRLVFGITTAPAIWQAAIEQVLQGLPGVQVYLDDILVTGRTKEEHLKNLDQVLTRLRERGLKLKKEKCDFVRDSLEFLGHVIDAKGVHKSGAKVDKIKAMPEPTDAGQLRSYLGMLNYYRKYLPNLATILSPLTALLQKGRKFEWSAGAAKAFQRSKEMLCESGFLVHFDPSLPVTVATDASPTGVGAVLSHVYPNGEERPIQFASRSLTKAEQNYPQIEREALGIVFALKRFHMFVYGRKFTLITDNKPLTALFGPKKDLPTLAAERMLRWAIFLAGFDYDIKYRNTKDNGNADCLSRLPSGTESMKENGTVVSICHADILPCSREEIRNYTRRDPTLSKVVRYTLDGWPRKLSEDEGTLKPFFNRKQELTLEQGIPMWGMRVVIPSRCRSAVLQELHEGHIGIVKMKSVARSYIWWPGIDEQIEKIAASCKTCQVVQNNPRMAPLHPWIPASNPWERVHMDFAGPFEGLTYMVMVDAYSKWPEVFIMSSITTERTLAVLRTVFSRNGIPQILVTDNGSQFTSQEFQEFVKANGIKHKLSAPYHASTNGQAERFVQSLKQAIRASKQDGGSPQTKLDRFLLAYRNAAHSVTGETPAMLFLKRSLRIRLDNLRPNLEIRYKDQLFKQASYRTKRAKAREFEENDLVLVRNYLGKPKWVPGVIIAREGPLNYQVKVDSRVWRRHLEQILPRYELEASEKDIQTTGSEKGLEKTNAMSDRLFDISQGLFTPTESKQELVPRDYQSVESEVQSPKTITPKPTKDVQAGDSSNSKRELMIEGENEKFDHGENSVVSELSQPVQGSEKKDKEIVLRRSTRVRKPKKLFTL